MSASEIDGKSWTSVIDYLGNVARETDANGNVTEYRRDSNGLITEIRTVDPDNPTGPQLVTRFEYNSQARVTKITFADTTYVEYGYAANGLDLLSFRNERGKLWTYTVDAAGNRLTQTDPLGKVTTWTYDSRGNVLSVTLPDPDGTGGPLEAPVTLFEYDGHDRVTKVTNPDLTFRTYTYDSVTGNLETETDEPNRTTSYTYDAYGRIATVTLPDPEGAGPQEVVWSYVWCACGSIKSVTDPLGNVTTYEYDSVTGLLESVTSPDPDGAGSLPPLVTTWTYDSLGRVESETTSGRVTSYTYDGNGNLSGSPIPTGPVRCQDR